MSELLTIEEAQTIRKGDFVSLCRDYGDVWHEIASDWPDSSLYEVFDESRPNGKEIHSFEHAPIGQIHRKGEPWKPRQARIICTSSGDYGRTKNGPARALLPDMTGSDDPEILSYFVFSNSISIEEKGIEIPIGAWVNTAGEVSVWAFAVHPQQIYSIIRKTIREDNPVSLVFGIDRHLKDGQGTTLRDGLSVTLYHKGEWRFGIMEYQFSPLVIKPICWDNPTWIEFLKMELKSCGVI